MKKDDWSPDYKELGEGWTDVSGEEEERLGAEARRTAAKAQSTRRLHGSRGVGVGETGAAALREKKKTFYYPFSVSCRLHF